MHKGKGQTNNAIQSIIKRTNHNKNILPLQRQNQNEQSNDEKSINSQACTSSPPPKASPNLLWQLDNR